MPKFAVLIMVSCLLRTNKDRSVVARPRSSLSQKVENILWLKPRTGSQAMFACPVTTLLELSESVFPKLKIQN